MKTNKEYRMDSDSDLPPWICRSAGYHNNTPFFSNMAYQIALREELGANLIKCHRLFHDDTITSPMKALIRGYTCDFLFALETRHPRNGSSEKVKGSCTCSQLPPISSTY